MIYKFDKSNNKGVQVFKDQDDLEESEFEDAMDEAIAAYSPANVLTDQEKEIISRPDSVRFTIDPNTQEMVYTSSSEMQSNQNIFMSVLVTITRVYSAFYASSPENAEIYKEGILDVVNNDDFWKQGVLTGEYIKKNNEQ